MPDRDRYFERVRGVDDALERVLPLLLVSSDGAAMRSERAEVVRTVLSRLAADDPVVEVGRKLRRYDDRPFPFPGDVLIEVAASALAVAGATPTTPVSLEDATERCLPEWPARGKTGRQKHRAAMNAAISAHAGVVVNYDEIAGWWRVQDFTFHAFETAVVLIRVAAQHTGRSITSVCDEIANRLGVKLDDPDHRELP